MTSKCTSAYTASRKRCIATFSRCAGTRIEVIAYLRGQGVFFSLNHLLHFYRGQAPLHEYLRLLEQVPALEVRNGAMLKVHNLLIEEIASRRNAGGNQTPIATIGGSDAHTLRRIGRTWTEAPGRNRAEFLDSLRRGLCRPGGDHGDAATVAADTYGVIRSYAASLIGLGPRDHRGLRRAACLAFTGVSLPFQFLPMAIALAMQARGRWCGAHGSGATEVGAGPSIAAIAPG